MSTWPRQQRILLRRHYSLQIGFFVRSIVWQENCIFMTPGTRVRNFYGPVNLKSAPFFTTGTGELISLVVIYGYEIFYGTDPSLDN